MIYVQFSFISFLKVQLLFFVKKRPEILIKWWQVMRFHAKQISRSFKRLMTSSRICYRFSYMSSISKSHCQIFTILKQVHKGAMNIIQLILFEKKYRPSLQQSNDNAYIFLMVLKLVDVLKISNKYAPCIVKDKVGYL